MRSIGPAVLFFLFALGVASVSTASSEVTALRVREKSFDPQTRELRYELWNESDKTVTAWRLSLAAGDSHGHGQRSFLDQDYFERLAPTEAGTRRGPIAPGTGLEARWRLTRDSSNPGPAVLSLSVRSVIFDDLSWQGEPEAVAILLEARAARIREIGRVLLALEGQTGVGGSAGAEWSAILRQQAQRLEQRARAAADTLGERRETAAVISATRMELARWLEQGSLQLHAAGDPDEVVRQLIAGLRNRYEVGLQALGVDAGEVLESGAARGGER